MTDSRSRRLAGARVKFIALVLVAASGMSSFAADDPLEVVVGRLVDGIFQLRGEDRHAELRLVANGASREDADRFVRSLTEGFVRCLVNELKSYSAQQEESFSQRLRTVQDSMDTQGVPTVLQDLLTLARAQSGSSDACAVDELKKAGVSVDALN
jgi:hypothetical protein